MNRRSFLVSAAATTGLALAKPMLGKNSGAVTLTRKERVDRALKGQEVDRPPFSLWRHFKKPTAQEEGQAHLNFHRRYDTDFVKVMNDFDYPKSTTGKWYELKTLDSPYPDQLRTLEVVRGGLNGEAYFIDTLYGPYMTAMILFGDEPQFAGQPKSEELNDKVISGLLAFQKAHPQEWEQAIEAITQSTINHIQRAKQTGSSGALVSIFNAESKFGSVSDYQRYSRPYDKRVLDALADTQLTFLHLHYLERPYLSQFHGFHAPVINYSVKTSGIPISEVRKQYSQAIAGGVDEVDYDKLTTKDIRQQWTSAREQAGSKYIITPGCSVPNTSTQAELSRLPQSLGIARPVATKLV